MTDKIAVLVTGGSLRECKRIATHLLEKRLIACANIVPMIHSVYSWKGKIAKERECLMVLKTTREAFENVRIEVEKLHSYAVPEIIALSIIDGAANYLNWIGESVAVTEAVAEEKK